MQLPGEVSGFFPKVHQAFSRGADKEHDEVIKPAMILILFGYVPVVFLTSFWPDLSLFFPGLFGY